MAIADVISKFILETNYEDIPAKTIEFTKELALKTMAGMIAGSKTESTKKIIEYAKMNLGAPEVGVIGCDFKSSLETAIFVNGYTSHAAELEDDQFPSATSDITVFPVTFALAERLHLTGEQFLEASALGLEVMNRLGMYSLTPIGVTDLPFYGVIGAAVATAKALSLDHEQIKSAIGIAIGRAGGYISNFGTDAHYLESAIACRDGYLAAVFAKNGMTGGTNIEQWLTNLLQGRDYDLSQITNGLGETWFIHNIWIKKYPCCFLTHRQIDMLRQIKKEKNIDPKDVDLIQLEVGPIDGTCDRPNPVDIEDSRFSLQHILSGVLLEEDMHYGIFSEAKIADERYQQMRSRVKVKINEDWPREFNSGIAHLTLTLKNGEQHEMRLKQAFGGPESPLKREEHIDIFKLYTAGKLPDENIRDLYESILSLENLSDVGRVIDFVNN
ncbi:MmgE/PrpD family protein [Aneurinibacillus terranovensis]|uniref:MmgE/PrpD family protein n=1 Tax=Aneurinibacillus terranovensis TaxID=278991 RepID=UPI0003FB4A87|nr:MmgE/PrpD family protein [Aneurinibacillus terranovensis]